MKKKRRKKAKRNSLTLIVALVLMVGCVVGGTLAWLTAETDPVVNTFTTSDIDITLEETREEYKMVPGWTIHKDPKVTVVAGYEECYLFVKLDESANFNQFLEYVVADGWTQGDGTNIPTNVYYREVEADDISTAYSVLKNDQVSVKGEVTKEMMKGLTENTNTYPTLTVTAYASQLYKNNTETFTAAEAWNNAQPTVTP